MAFLCIGFCSLLICGIIGLIIGNAKGQGGMGFTVGFLFGPFGVLIACFLPEDKQASQPTRRPTPSKTGGRYFPPTYPAELPGNATAAKPDDDPLGFLKEK